MTEKNGGAPVLCECGHEEDDHAATVLLGVVGGLGRCLACSCEGFEEAA